MVCLNRWISSGVFVAWCWRFDRRKCLKCWGGGGLWPGVNVGVIDGVRDLTVLASIRPRSCDSAGLVGASVGVGLEWSWWIDCCQNSG
jgi:hypothetical protein